MMDAVSILVVDSDPKNLQILRESLESYSFRVTTVDNGIDAWGVIQSQKPDVILCEVDISGLNGFELQERLQKSNALASIPLVFLTNRRNLEDRIRSLRSGVKDYMIKPLHVKEVIARIQMILRRIERLKNEHVVAEKTETGKLEDKGIEDLIEVYGLERKTGVLTVYDEHNRNGEIYFREGMVINARLGNFKAEKAVYQMLPWKSGRYTMTFKEITVEEEITVSNLGLLLQGFKRLQQQDKLIRELPSRETVLVKTPVFEEVLKRKTVSTDAGKFISLFDGQRTVGQVVAESIYDDLKTLEKTVQLYKQGFVAPLPVKPVSHVANVRPREFDREESDREESESLEETQELRPLRSFDVEREPPEEESDLADEPDEFRRTSLDQAIDRLETMSEQPEPSSDLDDSRRFPTFDTEGELEEEFPLADDLEAFARSVPPRTDQSAKEQEPEDEGESESVQEPQEPSRFPAFDLEATLPAIDPRLTDEPEELSEEEEPSADVAGEPDQPETTIEQSDSHEEPREEPRFPAFDLDATLPEIDLPSKEEEDVFHARSPGRFDIEEEDKPESKDEQSETVEPPDDSSRFPIIDLEPETSEFDYSFSQSRQPPQDPAKKEDEDRRPDESEADYAETEAEEKSVHNGSPEEESTFEVNQSFEETLAEGDVFEEASFEEVPPQAPGKSERPSETTSPSPTSDIGILFDSFFNGDTSASGHLAIIGTDSEVRRKLIATLTEGHFSVKSVESLAAQTELGKIVTPKRNILEIIGLSSDKKLVSLLDQLSNTLIGFVVLIGLGRSRNLGYWAYLLNSLRKKFAVPHTIAVHSSEKEGALPLADLRRTLRIPDEEVLVELQSLELDSARRLVENLVAAKR